MYTAVRMHDPNLSLTYKPTLFLIELITIMLDSVVLKFTVMYALVLALSAHHHVCPLTYLNAYSLCLCTSALTIMY